MNHNKNNLQNLQSNKNNHPKIIYKKHMMKLRNKKNVVSNEELLNNMMNEINEKKINAKEKELEIKEKELDIREIELNIKEFEMELKNKENQKHTLFPEIKNESNNLSNLFSKLNYEIDEIDTEIDDSEDDENNKNNKNNKRNKNKNENKNENEKKNDKKRNREIIDNNEEENDPFADLVFTVINMNNPHQNNHPEPPNKKQKTDDNDFYSYFQEATELTPIIKEIKTLQDLIDLGKTYDPNDKKRYVIQMRALHKCVPVLEELDAMIGMKNVKSMIMDLLFFRLQNIEDKEEVQEKKQKPNIKIHLPPFLRPPMCNEDGCESGEEDKINIQNMESLNKDTNSLKEMYHMVITGSPGSGKTEVAKILAKLYYTLGITKKDKFTLAKRSDLIGKYLGHTAKMTQDVFNRAKGGILFIDEAYSLGNPEGRDSFSKECIDTINQNLTENKDTVVFIAGYKEQLEESFFAYNPGLHRRFKFRLEVDKYNAEELRLIYLKKIKDSKWNIYNNDTEKEIPLTLFEKHREIFKFNGGDMENLWHLTKIAHARRIFGKSRDLVKKINVDDIKKAIELYMENDEVKKRNDDIKKYIHDTLYV